MKIKHLILSVVVLFSASFFVFTTGNSKITRHYYPKVKTDNDLKGIHGAMEWLKMQKVDLETKTIDMNDVLRAEKQVMALRRSPSAKSLGLEWIEMGPDNVGGRTRAILVDKNNPNLVYSGGVAGGLWKSVTGGTSWERINVDGSFNNLAITSICQAANGDIYVGTGESAFTGADGDNDFTTNGMRGQGIWKKPAGSDAFTRLNSTWNDLDDSYTIFYEVSRLAAHPTNPNRIYAATRKGLKISNDGGATWVTGITGAYGGNRAKDVKVASDGGVVVNIAQRLYYSPTGDVDSYTIITPDGLTSERIEIAIAPSDPNYIYIQAVASDGSLAGIYKSTDKGLNWTIIGIGGFESFNPLGNQGTYDNTIAVFPDDKDRVILGGQYSLWIGTISGSSYGWVPITMWYLSELNPNYVHADHHTIVFHPDYKTASNPDGNQIVYIGSDGGVSKSTDGAVSFQVMNKKYNVTQFYTVACSPTGMAMGGTQDNGTQFLYLGGNTLQNSLEVKGGDGGFCAFSVLNPNVLFATTYYGDLGRSGALENDDCLNFYSTNITTKYPIGEAGAASFVTPIDLWESFNDVNSRDSITFKNNVVLFELENDDEAHSYYDSLDAIYSEVYLDTVTDPENDKDYLGVMVYYHTGERIVARSVINGRILNYTLTSPLDPGEEIIIQDKYQAMMAVGLSDNVWVTRRPLDFSGNSPWYPINNTDDPEYELNMITNLAWTTDGDILYFSDFSWSGGSRVFRCKNFSQARTYNITLTDTTTVYVIDETEIEAIDSTLEDSTYIGIQIDTVGFLVDTAAEPDDTVWDIEINYLYSYIWEIDTTFGYDTTYIYDPNNVLFNSIDADDEDGNCVLEIDLIGTFGGRTVTGLNVDPNNPERLLVTLGNFGSSEFVQYCGNAASTTTTTGNFVSKQGNLPEMPVYDGIFILESGAGTLNKVLIGTEYGVYATNDISAGSVEWSDENASGMENVPVFQIVQQTWANGWYDEVGEQSGVTNGGFIYIGTHGRGIFRCEKYAMPVSVPENNFAENKVVKESVQIYPNPVSDIANVSYQLAAKGNVNIKVYDLNGRIMKSFTIENKNAGKHLYSFDASDLRSGTYIISLTRGDSKAASRFVVY